MMTFNPLHVYGEEEMSVKYCLTLGGRPRSIEDECTIDEFHHNTNP